MDNLSSIKHRRSRTDQPLPEWGDVKDVRRLFGLKEHLVYSLMHRGVIESVSIRGRGRTRGKRLVSLVSVRRMLSDIAAAEPQRVPPQ